MQSHMKLQHVGLHADWPYAACMEVAELPFHCACPSSSALAARNSTAALRSSLVSLFAHGNSLTGTVPAAWAGWGTPANGTGSPQLQCLFLRSNPALCGARAASLPWSGSFDCFSVPGTSLGKQPGASVTPVGRP
jgi:hypothetical protein